MDDVLDVAVAPKVIGVSGENIGGSRMKSILDIPGTNTRILDGEQMQVGTLSYHMLEELCANSFSFSLRICKNILELINSFQTGCYNGGCDQLIIFPVTDGCRDSNFPVFNKVGFFRYVEYILEEHFRYGIVRLFERFYHSL